MTTTTRAAITAAKTISPKVIVSTAASFVASVLLGVVLAVQAHPEVTHGLPAWAVFVLAAALPPIATFLGGYVKRDPLREQGGVVTDPTAGGFHG